MDTNGAAAAAPANYGATGGPNEKHAVKLVASASDPSKMEHQLLKHESDPSDKISGKAWGRVKNMFTRKGEYPMSVFFIIGNEFCERFSFYGMKTILILYLTLQLKIEANTSTAIYHTFTMLCYFTPLIGALIADSFLGKYKTILYISLIYCIGNVVMALTAIPPAERYGPMIGLCLIAFGTGGIKPCVAAFGGDQFSQGQEKQIQGFFSVFYFAINSGSLLSTLVTPILRADVQCFGSDCYVVAFGIPAILMLLSLTIFFAGRNQYKKNPPTGNLFAKVCGCIFYSLKQSLVQRHNKDQRAYSHWLNLALDKYDPVFVEEVKSLLRVLVMFLPLPLFWALFDQQGSRWTLQAELMNGSLGKLGILKPDQMQAINPILIILMIPLFESVIYPLMDRWRIPNRPLQRMITGMIFATSAFIMAGFVQLHLNDTMNMKVPNDQSRLTLFNMAPCQISVDSPYFTGDVLHLQSDIITRRISGNSTIKYSKSCGSDEFVEFKFTLEMGQAKRLFFYEKDSRIQVQMAIDKDDKPPKGLIAISFFSLIPKDDLEVLKLKAPSTYAVINLTENAVTPFVDVDPALYNVYGLNADDEWFDTNNTLRCSSSASYTVVAMPNYEQKKFYLRAYQGLVPNTVSMMLQIPQYILITTGEVMFSITGLSFAYSQAPSSMKSVLQASWLLTVAMGNLIVVVVAEAKLVKNQAIEFFLFAALMAVDVIIFSMMSMFYRYNDYAVLANAQNVEDEVVLVDEDISIPTPID